MPQNRNDILTLLTDLASAKAGSVWPSVVSSLVGQELLSFGADVLALNRSGEDAVNGVDSLARKDIDGVISFAYTNEVSVDTNRPSSVKIRLENVDIVCAPYEIQLAIGTSTFYNIEYCRTTSEVTLYQGRIHRMFSYTPSEADPILSELGGASVTNRSWALFQEFTEGKFQSSYVKLGVGVISQSIRVFARPVVDGVGSGAVFPYTEYNALNSNPSAKLYKARTGWDRSVNVLFGDSNWAQSVSPDIYHYQLVWLLGGTARFTLTSSAKVTVASGSTLLTLGQVPEGSSQQGYRVLSTTDGEVNSLSYAKNMVLSELFLKQGIVTDTQIRNFIASFDSVGSSLVSSSGGTVSVIIKPSDPSDVSFQFIEDFLYQYGVDGIEYSVTAGTPLPFIVVLEAASQEGIPNLTQAKRYVESILSYDSLSIQDSVTSSWINQQLLMSGIVGVSAKLVVREPLRNESGSVTLSSLPVPNTINQYDSDGTLVGFDSDGIYKYLSDAGIDSSQLVLSRVGDFFYGWTYSGGVTHSYLFDASGDELLATDASLVFGNKHGIFSSQGEFGWVFLDFTDQAAFTVSLYADSNVFRRGDASLFKRTSYVTPLWSYSLVLPSAPSFIFPDLLKNFVYDGSYLYIPLSTIVGESQIYRFVLRNQDGGGAPFFQWDTDLDNNGITVGSPSVMANQVQYVDGKVFVPSGGSASDFTFLSYDLFDPVTGGVIHGSVQYDTGTSAIPVLSIFFSGSSLYMIENQDSNTVLHRATYSFLDGGDRLSVSLVDSVTFNSGDISADPTTISGFDSMGRIMLLPFFSVDDPTIWNRLYPVLASDPSGVSTASARMFAPLGSVDYVRGVIYNIVSSGVGDDTLVYDVSGALVGGSAQYPVLSEVEIR